jgi:hypothetical protein
MRPFSLHAHGGLTARHAVAGATACVSGPRHRGAMRPRLAMSARFAMSPRLRLPAGRPGPHDLPQDRELADVVGVVVGDEADLAKTAGVAVASSGGQYSSGQLGSR